VPGAGGVGEQLDIETAGGEEAVLSSKVEGGGKVFWKQMVMLDI